MPLQVFKLWEETGAPEEKLNIWDKEGEETYTGFRKNRKGKTKDAATKQILSTRCGFYSTHSTFYRCTRVTSP